MRLKALATITAAAALCMACVEINPGMGGNLVPVEQTYQIYISSRELPEIKMMMADSMSGYSSTRITIGALRDEQFGLTTRSSAITLLPLNDSLDFGTDPKLRRMHFSAALDTLSTSDETFDHILQNVHVYELSRPLDARKDFDCNAVLPHKAERISIGTPIINGSDSLSFDFSLDYARKFLDITKEDLADKELYFQKIPGIFLETSQPGGKGGRINMFKLQLGYDKTQNYLTGNYARLDFSAEYDGVRKDTAFFFYYGGVDIIPSDSLFTNYSTGSFPQYALNLTGHETEALEGASADKVIIEGGGGLKPVISAKMLTELAREMIAERGADYNGVVINRATIELPFDFPDDYRAMDKYPKILSPTCRLMTDTTATFMSLTDSSNSNENQGNIDRSNLRFAPDITYHLQELVKIKNSDRTKLERLDNGSFDIWLLVNATEVVTEESSSQSNDMSEYYQYLAYQSYYNNMYGGYGGYGGYGYGGYGYGGYGGNYYNNYYTYMMMAQYANSANQTKVSTSQMLDRDRYYNGWLNGPAHSSRRPRLVLTFSVPNRPE